MNGTPLLNLPPDLQVNVLTYLRAYDLSALQMTCKFYANPALIGDVVCHFAENIYPTEFTLGFAAPREAKGGNGSRKKGGQKQMIQQERSQYTFEQLRNMELLVVARCLNSPEPSSGFYISKSWCKTALLWLEVQQQESQIQQNKTTKKLSKKKQRMRDRKLSDASPPWSNANVDILCEHQNLQRCSNGKSARARRRLLDRQAWKILKRLYPDSTSLESAVGECLQCTVEAETAKKNEADRLESAKIERKRPLANEDVRRFYTRRTGVPTQAISPTASLGQCPLQHGNYYVLPRAWCYAWRRYVKTGEGGICPPPDAATLLCDAHRLALVPPHLEAYLYGETAELLSPSGDIQCWEVSSSSGAEANPPPARGAGPGAVGIIPGQMPDSETVEALRAAGLGSQIFHQVSMYREIEESQRREAEAAAAAAPPSSPHIASRELLDWENYTVVEILTESEYLALESCWSSGNGFGLRFGVSDEGVSFHTTDTCQRCDATGRQHSLHIRNRSRKALRKTQTKETRAPASLEY